jgi:hypothetical protein
MKGDITQIMKTVKEMRTCVARGDKSLQEIIEMFGEFRHECPKLFDLVLENKPGYYQELQNMLGYAKKVKTGEASMEDATKVVKNIYDRKYVYPVLESKSRDLDIDQRAATEAYVRDQQAEVERLEAYWAEKHAENDSDDEISDYE